MPTASIARLDPFSATVLVTARVFSCVIERLDRFEVFDSVVGSDPILMVDVVTSWNGSVMFFPDPNVIHFSHAIACADRVAVRPRLIFPRPFPFPFHWETPFEKFFGLRVDNLKFNH